MSQSHRFVREVVLVCLAAAALVGCTAQGVKPAQEKELFTYREFSAPLGQPLTVNTGDALFVEGRFIEGEAIMVRQPLDLMIPGSMMIPFPVHIEPGRLTMSRVSGGWKYFCAEEGKAAASFPTLGSVLAQGDCVGIRVSSSNGEKQWVVDNSNYNRGWGKTVWTKRMSHDEAERYQPEWAAAPFQVDSLKRIVFDGYYGGQLHFSWEEYAGNSKDSREFVFDFDGKPTLIGIKGNQLVVNHADNVQLSYEWREFN